MGYCKEILIDFMMMIGPLPAWMQILVVKHFTLEI